MVEFLGTVEEIPPPARRRQRAEGEPSEGTERERSRPVFGSADIDPDHVDELVPKGYGPPFGRSRARHETERARRVESLRREADW
jgi:hypothetical protein